MDEELKQLDLATAEARRLASARLEALRAPQAALVEAATNYVGSIAERRLEAARHASVEVMAKFSDDDMAELRLWTDEQIALATDQIGREIESCDFWIPEAAGMSPTDVSAFSNALMPKPKDTRTGIPHALVVAFDNCLGPLRRGLAAVGLASIPTDAEPRTEVALARAWRNYRDAAVDCISRWADVDEHYHASAERFQEMRWELAGQVDANELKARLEADEVKSAEESLADQASRAADAVEGAFARADSETLIPVSG